MKRNYIGLACTGHDNALAIINSNGELVFAEATERYQQNKRAINTPPDDIIQIESLIDRYCEHDAELVVAKTWSDTAVDTLTREAHLAAQRKQNYSANDPLNFIGGNADIYRHVARFVCNNINNTGPQLNFRCETTLQRQVQLKAYDHHLTHAAAGCYNSPFEQAVCVIVDGFGEGSSVAVFHYQVGELIPIETTSMAGNIEKSLGVFYGTLCGFCGFDIWRGEEWKVMGLAPYGKHNPEIHRLLRERIKVEGLQLKCPEEGNRAIEPLLSYARKPGQSALEVADLAYTGQRVYSELMQELLQNVYNLGLSDNLVLGGGCALNSSYNGTILSQTGFRQLYVFCAPADDGNAVGAARLAYLEDNPGPGHPPRFQTPYLGSGMSAVTLQNLANLGGLTTKRMAFDDLAAHTATLLAQGNVIGWVQGRAEFGPRALGNRSILADPRTLDMKDKINERVKFREEFRPFAPSILHEFGPEYFVDYQESPYMERTLQFREEVKHKVAAVVHADGSGRLQTVKQAWNARYYALIQAFYHITGVPMLLNTSFNVMGKPIIHSVEDALAVLFTSGLDALIIDDTLIEKKQFFEDNNTQPC